MREYRGAVDDSAPWRSREHVTGELDGWFGTPGSPGYRAGRIVARLSHQPDVAVGALCCDMLLLDATGRSCDALRGACASLSLAASAELRSRFVCLSAELLRHAVGEERRFGTLAQVVSQLRELGVERAPLMAAARLLDVTGSDESVIESLADMLVRSFGDDEARLTLDDIVARLIRSRHVSPALRAPDDASLREQLALLVRGLGRHRVRHVLRLGSDFDLLPQIEMYRL